MTFDLGDYVAVNDRVIMFFDQFPQGSISTSKPEVCAWRDDMIMCQAIVYRDPEDRLPVTAWATEYAEGKTPYTRGREVENASTSAVGRALGYLKIGIKAGMASADEVKQQQDRQAAPVKAKKPPLRPVAPEVDPWATETLPLPPEPENDEDLGEAIAALEGGTPQCAHGSRVWKTGTGKTGKPWQAWMCKERVNGCEPLWR